MAFFSCAFICQYPSDKSCKKGIFQVYFILVYLPLTQKIIVNINVRLYTEVREILSRIAVKAWLCSQHISKQHIFPLVNRNSDIKCDMRQINCVSVSSGSTLCSCHVLEFHLQISIVNNCSMHLKIVIYIWCMEPEEISLRESFKWLCMLFSFWSHGFPQTNLFLLCFPLNIFTLLMAVV